MRFYKILAVGALALLFAVSAQAEPYKLRPVLDEADLCGVVRYVARNPVRADLCERPQDWRWSSYLASAGYAKPFPFVELADTADPKMPMGERMQAEVQLAYLDYAHGRFDMATERFRKALAFF